VCVGWVEYFARYHDDAEFSVFDEQFLPRPSSGLADGGASLYPDSFTFDMETFKRSR
jgi:hypothetical protein